MKALTPSLFETKLLSRVIPSLCDSITLEEFRFVCLLGREGWSEGVERGWRRPNRRWNGGIEIIQHIAGLKYLWMTRREVSRPPLWASMGGGWAAGRRRGLRLRGAL